MYLELNGKKNAIFFLEHDLSGTILDDLNLKLIWKDANDNTKKQIWLYIKVIFKICEKYINSKKSA